MSTRRALQIAACAFAVSLGSSLQQARAQDAFAGNWKVSQADKAPWADTAPKPDAELRGLLGKGVAFLKARIDGPRPLRCAKLKYQVKEYAADMLFQGALKEPEEQAKALGFKAFPVKTLETGCANELEFHMADADTLLFGLNDRVYTLRRQKP